MSRSADRSPTDARSARIPICRAGWADAPLTYLDLRIYAFWKYFLNASVRDAGLRIDHFLLSLFLGALGGRC
ncbi:hypothetical protein ELI44_37135 [Rhizobium ruizarguesonis]|nr:hypothetical protein ELI42_37155 [Rhizobium ruizarguesonis]TAU45870.1 hypothetical protein ELI44_37135 [Rhizobium ruizarguesonis]